MVTMGHNLCPGPPKTRVSYDKAMFWGASSSPYTKDTQQVYTPGHNWVPSPKGIEVKGKRMTCSIITVIYPVVGQSLLPRSNMGTFPDSLGMTSYTLAILFLALKTIVKKLFCIEIMIFHTFTLSEV
jgi:hypothetical protein